MMTGLDRRDRTEALRWLYRQSEDVRVEVMVNRFRNYMRMSKRETRLTAPELDYCALIVACRDCGWLSEKRSIRNAMLLDSDIRRLARNRLALAREGRSRRELRRELLAKN